MPADFNTFRDSLVLPDGKEDASTNHGALLSHVKKLLKKSRDDMAKYYSIWDYHDKIFRARREADREDRASVLKGEPAKMVVPLTFSQIMTFVAFAVQSVTQNKRFYELEHEGNKVNPLKEPMELILERDVRRNSWSSFLVQFFLDVGRFWLGAAEVCYREESRNIRVPQQNPVMGAFSNQIMQATNSFQSIPTFVGNKVYSISPYRFFPDTRFPLVRFQEGEFCGSEDMFSMTTLRSDVDSLFNLDKIPKLSEKDYVTRRQNSRIDEMDFIPEARAQNAPTDGDTCVKDGAVVVTKMVMDLIPSQFKVDDEMVLGKEEFPVRYIAWVANDATIIRFEEAYFLHGQFPYICAQYMHDQHKMINEGLSSICDQITSLVTWKLNAHMMSQKNSVESKWIIDPAGVDIKTLQSRSPYIFLKKNASQTGVDRYIKQFITQDVTANVMQDVGSLKDLLEAITGWSGQMQGQYSQGRRSATQDRVVAQGASARGKTIVGSIWDAAFQNLGKQLIANNRQEMDLETFQRIVGDGPFGQDRDIDVMTLFQMFKADPVAIAMSEDFFVFDATLPSEKAFLAQSLQEVLMEILQNPQIMQILGYGPEQLRYLFNEIYELRGVTPPELPEPTPTQQMQIQQAAGAQQGQAQPNVVPMPQLPAQGFPSAQSLIPAQ